MGFFSGVRRKIKKLIPKEIRPFIPYIAAGFSGPIGAKLGMSALAPMYQKALIAGGTKFLSDDEANLKDVGITAALAAAPSAISEYGGTDMIGNEYAKTAGDYLADKKLTTLASQAGIDAGIKQVELNEDALDKYNRELAAQGINDKAGRRAAIRSIYSNTGTWDMDEVDSMLDTYGYRTGGRVGYAMGDRVDTEQIIEDFQRIPSIGKGIGNLARAGVDNIDKIIEVIIKTNPILATGDKIVEILVERYGVDPAVAQRKVINRMSDSNEGFGPQGPQGTPDDGYNPNIGIDSGAEDYYGETPAMPGNLGDMGGSMDDMSGSRSRRRGRRGLDDLIEQMPNLPRPVPMPTPDMPRRPDGGEFMPMPLPRNYEPDFRTLPLPLDYERKYTPMENGGETERERRKRKREEFDEGFDYAVEGLDSLEALEDKYKPLPIRELRLQDGGSVDDRLMERVKELQDEGLDFASALAQAMKEDMAANKARGGIMDGIDINMREQIDTPRGDMMIDENIEVADSSLMDAYEIYKFDMMEQGLEPMSLEQFREQAIAESQMSSMQGSGRTMAASGGLMNLGGREMDLRGGGFVPMGAKERADDVPARLSKNEFVMTADAVRAAGGGSVQKGADLMYDQMKQLEGQA